jgi:hypothetical protein
VALSLSSTVTINSYSAFCCPIVRERQLRARRTGAASESVRDRVITVTPSTVIIALACLPLVGGALDLFSPSTAIRWQVRSTARARGLRQRVGIRFQRWLRVDALAEPWNDPRVKRSVRWIGVAGIVLSALMIVAGLLKG